MRAGERSTPDRQRGFTYLWVMAAVAVLGVGLAAIGPTWADAARRDKEQELLRVGQLYAEAIASYYKASPGSAKRFPPSLDALLLDTRFVGVYRHMRRLHADPLQPSQPWGIVRAPDGSVRGVYSRSADRPLRVATMDMGITVLPAAQRYSEWQFVPKVD